MDVVYNPSNVNQHALEELVNSLSPNSSSGDLSNDVQNEKSNDCPQNYRNKMSRPMNKKLIQRFTDSESDDDDEKLHKNAERNRAITDNNSDSNEENNLDVKNNRKHCKSRIRTISSSDSDEAVKDKVIPNNGYNLSRVKNKKERFAAKFNKLLSKQQKFASNKTSSDDQSGSEQNACHESENSEQELNSCNKIKKMFKKKEMVQIASICDPDTSDDEDITKNNKKPIIKSTKLTSPKPIRISAKEAMENMQKIKSEANRMLREKEVSLPYHKPKALSLKDIMSRRKPAVALDGKTLSVKMTAEQLEQYALQLEQRQKEMMELCKSDDDDEDECTDNKQDQEMNNDGQIVCLDSHGSDSTSTNDKTSNMVQLPTDNFVEPLESVKTKVNIENSPDLENTDAIVEILESNVETKCVTGANMDKIIVSTNNEMTSNVTKVDVNKENDSQIMELQYDSDKRTCDLSELNANVEMLNNIQPDNSKISNNDIDCIDFPADDFNLDDIDEINEHIGINDLGHNKNKQIAGTHLTEKPKLIGSPGMVIDLETGDTSEKKLTGVELLKERFQYFAKLKSLEEQEKDREKKYKPGMQHLKLRQELEDQIAEQRSLEWAKRLENESQHAQCNQSDSDDIEKLEAKLENLDDSVISKDESAESSEEEEIEDDCVIEDKPRKRNPMLDDEAEESDIEEEDIKGTDNNLIKETEMEEDEDVNTSDGDVDSSSEESEDESTKSNGEPVNGKQKRGRILKAFQDSDDEDNSMINGTKNHDENNSQSSSEKKDVNNSTSQDEELQLAQMLKTSSEDNCTQFNAPDSLSQPVEKPVKSQSFSIANSHSNSTLNCLEKLVNNKSMHFDAGLANKDMFLNNFSQDLNTQLEANYITESQEIGDDVAALCTGKFYDNPLVSQFDDNLQSEDRVNSSIDFTQTQESQDTEKADSQIIPDSIKKEENKALSSILEELNDPDFDKPKQNKYFANENAYNNKENILNIANDSTKKKFVIDSDDDNDEEENVEKNIKKKSKKRKKEKKGLQISDDEEDDFEEANEEVQSAESDIDDDSQRIVEYDSEENEVVMELPKSKKKRIGDFFEQEAELTSEDEWIGSGDEDEQGLDRMEREEGDNDVFQEDKLRNELGQIHMRDVLDQDKREVRLIQELLFEDGDLGDGHRQRKFRWRNAGDVDETGAALDELAETQEEEFESEEQWRKQRHEREVFLRKMKGIDDDDIPNTSINRTSIIKANLCSKTMSSLLDDSSENVAKNSIAEKRTHRDIPSPKKAYPVFQQNYHGSLLSRGKGALARLAAIATPLATDNDDAPKAMAANNRGKFVFAALTKDEVEPKISKRKADAVPASPGNIKKFKTDDKQIHLKSSLFDYL